MSEHDPAHPDHMHAEHAEQTEPDDFLVALSRVCPADVLDQASEALAEVAAGVREHQKKGSMTLTIDVAPMDKRPDAVEVVCKAKGKPPEPPPRARFLWPTEDGRLLTNDPRQQRMDL